jgi:hypothetical protein
MLHKYTNTILLLSHKRISQHPNALNLALNQITTLDKHLWLHIHAYTGQRTRQHQSACRQRRALTQERQYLRHTEQRVARTGVLHNGPVPASRHSQPWPIRRLTPNDTAAAVTGHCTACYDARSDGTEAVKALGEASLPSGILLALPVARGDVVADGEAEDVGVRVLTWNVGGGAGEDEAEFVFPVDVLCGGVHGDVGVRAGDAVGEFAEDDGIGGEGDLEFGFGVSWAMVGGWDGWGEDLCYVSIVGSTVAVELDTSFTTSRLPVGFKDHTFSPTHSAAVSMDSLGSP